MHINLTEGNRHNSLDAFVRECANNDVRKLDCIGAVAAMAKLSGAEIEDADQFVSDRYQRINRSADVTLSDCTTFSIDINHDVFVSEESLHSRVFRVLELEFREDYPRVVLIDAEPI